MKINYLPLYLGCQVKYTGDGKPFKGTRMVETLTMENLELMCFSNDRKLLLRPLSSMTPKEFRDLFGESFAESYCKARIKSISSSLWMLHKTIGEIGNFETVPNLLGKGFDLFDLIGKEQAIDKTK